MRRRYEGASLGFVLAVTRSQFGITAFVGSTILSGELNSSTWRFLDKEVG